MKKKNIQKSDGFTLIEILLYVSIVGIMILGVSLFSAVLFESRIKNQVVSEVEQVGAGAIRVISQSLRDAWSINSPATSTSANTLSLSFSSSTKNPTVFDVSSGTLRISEGGGAPLAITSPQVIVSDVSFWNLSRGGTKGTIRAQFTLSYFNQSGRNEYSYSKKFMTSGTLRY